MPPKQQRVSQPNFLPHWTLVSSQFIQDTLLFYYYRSIFYLFNIDRRPHSVNILLSTTLTYITVTIHLSLLIYILCASLVVYCIDGSEIELWWSKAYRVCMELNESIKYKVANVWWDG